MKDIEQMNHQTVAEYYSSDISKLYRNYDYFKIREKIVSTLLRESVGQRILDIGAGDCFWSKHFIDKVDLYIAIEKEEENCKLIEKNLALCNNISILKNDVFYLDFFNINADTLFLGFFASHFELSSIIKLILRINQYINFDRIVILDSFWSDYRKNKFGINKLMLQRRVLNEKGDIVKIPKRFVSVEDLQELSFAAKMKLKIKYADNYWCLAVLNK